MLYSNPHPVIQSQTNPIHFKSLIMLTIFTIFDKFDFFDNWEIFQNFGPFWQFLKFGTQTNSLTVSFLNFNHIWWYDWPRWMIGTNLYQFWGRVWPLVEWYADHSGDTCPISSEDWSMVLAQRSIILNIVMILLLVLMLMLMLKTVMLKILGCPIRWSNYQMQTQLDLIETAIRQAPIKSKEFDTLFSSLFLYCCINAM